MLSSIQRKGLKEKANATVFDYGRVLAGLKNNYPTY